MKIKGYELIEPAIQGGMAVVYKGQNEKGITRAFKMVRPDKAAHSARLCQQFLEEIKLQLQLDHTNIVKILDTFPYTNDETGETFTVLEMDWLDGMDLERYVETKAKKGLDEKFVEKILLQVLEGLEYAHKKQILHLDIKPSNLFITKDGHIRIIDFGLAKVIGNNAKIIDGAEKLTTVTVTGESSFKGTTAFSSPEQQVGGKLGYYSDIYSLGKTLHFLCTGSTDPSVEVKSQKMATLIEHCTYEAPKKRYQTCTELRTALKDATLRKCIRCRKEISVGVRYCPNCGADQTPPPPPPPPTKKCPNCGKVYTGDPAFCTNCGWPLKPISWKCKNCGSAWKDNYNDGKTKYCKYCGSEKIVKTVK